LVTADGRSGWAFRDGDGFSRDPINGFAYLAEADRATDPSFRGRVTAPVLWDTRSRSIVSNSDDDIMRIFEVEFATLAGDGLDMYPADLRDEIDARNEWLYENLNNGVYKAGFTTRQAVYEEAARFHDAHSFRRGVSRPLQVQFAPHRRLSPCVALSRRFVPDSGRCRNCQGGSDQDPLLLHA
jgi:hypothetical protein